MFKKEIRECCGNCKKNIISLLGSKQARVSYKYPIEKKFVYNLKAIGGVKFVDHAQ